MWFSMPCKSLASIYISTQHFPTIFKSLSLSEKKLSKLKEPKIKATKMLNQITGVKTWETKKERSEEEIDEENKFLIWLHGLTKL